MDANNGKSTIQQSCDRYNMKFDIIVELLKVSKKKKKFVKVTTNTKMIFFYSQTFCSHTVI